MIDITTGEPQVVESRQQMHKNFNIDVTINDETHNLKIDIYHTEDVDGSDTTLDKITMSCFTFAVSDKITMSCFTFAVSDGLCDIEKEIHGHLENWFNNKFRNFMVEEKKEDFDNIFSAVWEYIEEKDLY